MKREARHLLNQANSYIDKKLYDNSLFYLNKAIAIEPREPELWIAKGRALASKEEFPTAVQCFINAINLDPKNEMAWISLGLAYHCIREYEDAIDAFDKAIEINPQNDQAWYAKGVALFLMHDYENALAQFERTLQLYPIHRNAAIFKKDCEKRLGRKSSPTGRYGGQSRGDTNGISKHGKGIRITASRRREDEEDEDKLFEFDE